MFLLALASAFGLLFAAVFGSLLDVPGSSLGVGGVTVALIGAPFVIWRSVVAQKTVNVTEQGHITDRINTAVLGLGAEKEKNRLGRDFSYVVSGVVQRDFEWQDEELLLSPDAEDIQRVPWQLYKETVPNLEVRIGAIYALERIAQDSDRDHIQIMEILCAYIRENARTNDLTPTESPFENSALRVDLQTAIDVIGRRSNDKKALEIAQRHRLDLRGTDLSFANFAKGDFSAAILAGCKLEACTFRDTDLSGAILHNSVLNFSDFFRCNLTGAKLDGVVINRPVPVAGGWTASINMAELKGVSFPSADLSALQYLGTASKMNQMMDSSDTILSGNLKHTMPDQHVMEKNIYRRMENLAESDIDDLTIIENVGFKYWFPFDASRDMAFAPGRRMFLQDMGLNCWPYIEE
ncbi:pentapeptide repeat-containing protein [Roseovarius gaetbuli]|uniref:pentapeptide repeat-containing protein n=1 Tax=Roseovarius gaetbuli TaxID=1356575 RepID=UPI001483313C|nr:pentapeptide repeat-containing protein [Roseovarius gaetbuli]